MAVWPFRPQNGVITSWEWLTNIIRCRSDEYRQCLRPIPRQGMSLRYELDSDDYAAAREMARSIGGNSVLIPDWPSSERTVSLSTETVTLPIDASTIPSYKVGGKLIIWESNAKYEALDITGIGDGTIGVSAPLRSYTTPTVAPLRSGTFAQAFGSELYETSYVLAEATFNITSTEDWTALYGSGTSYQTYRGAPVVRDRAKMLNGVTESFERPVDVVDCQLGPIYQRPAHTTPTGTSVLAWYFQTWSSMWPQLLWLHSRKGRQKSFWASPWNADVVITRDVWNGDTTIEIASVGGFSSLYSLPCDLAIRSESGNAWIVRVTGATAGDAGKELLTLSESFVGNAELSAIVCTSKITKSRLNADRIEVQHRTAGAYTIVVPIAEVPA